MHHEDPSTAAVRLKKRLDANPSGLPVVIGLVDGTVCARESRPNSRVCTSMPHEKAWIPGSCSLEGVTDILSDALPRVAADVEAAIKAGKRAHRKPPRSHGWNRNRE